MPPTSKRARPQRTWNAPRTILACALDTYADTNRALRSVGIGPKQLLSNRDSPPEWVQKTASGQCVRATRLHAPCGLRQGTYRRRAGAGNASWKLAIGKACQIFGQR